LPSYLARCDYEALDPATDTVTHLVIQPGLQQEAARLVPADLVESTDGEVKLRCTRAEFDQLDSAEDIELTDEADQDAGSGGPLGTGPMYGSMSMPRRPRTIVEDSVPMGEEQLRRGDRVHAVDGEIGRVRGFLVNPSDDRVTHVLLEEGHALGRKEVAIPVAAVTSVDDGIRLNLTREQVRDLPPAD
jgi:PRC-barrel domain